eukprot:Platyproteum_vivax@DN7653_c0_g1_i1.p1
MDWALVSFPFNSECVLTLISADLHVWQRDLLRGVPLKKCAPLRRITSLKVGNVAGIVHASIRQNWNFVFYLAANGDLFYYCVGAVLKYSRQVRVYVDGVEKGLLVTLDVSQDHIECVSRYIQ